MSCIREEYERLCRAFVDKDSRRKIDELRWEATNYEKKENGHWYKKGAGMGDKVSGFAIDIISGRYLVSPPGADHSEAYRSLIQRAVELGRSESRPLDSIEDQIFKGWLVKIDDWEYRLCVISGLCDDEQRETVEEWVLEKGIGLPLNRLLLT